MPQIPLLLSPIFKCRRWGGSSIAAMSNEARAAGAPLGEAWLAADLPSSIPDGISPARFLPGVPSATQSLTPPDPTTLREAIDSAPSEWIGKAIPGPEGRFPLLLKILDAAEHLSVQVHPNKDYARTHPEAHMKSEAWIVLRHDVGAELYRGLDPSLSRQQLRAAMESGSILHSLIRVPARVGDAHWLPSGICHALGAGITALEVQTPSDTTFRAWDWDRHDPSRELHLDQAEACTLTGAAQQLEDLERLAHARGSVVPGSKRLVETPFFSIDRIDCQPGDLVDFSVASAPRIAWLWTGSWTTDGAATLPTLATIAIAASTVRFGLNCLTSGTIFVSTAATPTGESVIDPGFTVSRGN